MPVIRTPSPGESDGDADAEQASIGGFGGGTSVFSMWGTPWRINIAAPPFILSSPVLRQNFAPIWYSKSQKCLLRLFIFFARRCVSVATHTSMRKCSMKAARASRRFEPLRPFALIVASLYCFLHLTLIDFAQLSRISHSSRTSLFLVCSRARASRGSASGNKFITPASRKLIPCLPPRTLEPHTPFGSETLCTFRRYSTHCGRSVA